MEFFSPPSAVTIFSVAKIDLVMRSVISQPRLDITHYCQIKVETGLHNTDMFPGVASMSPIKSIINNDSSYIILSHCQSSWSPDVNMLTILVKGVRMLSQKPLVIRSSSHSENCPNICCKECWVLLAHFPELIDHPSFNWYIFSCNPWYWWYFMLMVYGCSCKNYL